jgi:hypothetical protein
VSDEGRVPSENRWARQLSALLLIGLVVVIVVLDVIVEGYEVNRASLSGDGVGYSVAILDQTMLCETQR